LNSRRILLIEDEADIAVLARFALEDAGYDVQATDNGTSGLEILRGDPSIGLVILDLMLPGMNGYEVLETIKSDPVLSKVPVLIFSALVQEREVDMGYRLGAVGYIRKPFDADNMLATIGRFFPNGGGNGDSA